MKKKQITQAELKEVLDYDPDTGVFRWKTSRGHVSAGSVAGSTTYHGYLSIMIYGNKYLGHRLSWLYVNGYFSENQLDHVNRIKTDNRIINLREVSQSCNIRNTGLLSNNTTGVKGVVFRKDTNLWRAQMTVNRKYLSLGHYKNKTDAVKARQTAEKEHNFQNCCSDSSAYLYLKEHNII